MTPDQAIDEAKGGALRPIYVIAGAESVLVRRAVEGLREAALAGGPTGFNDDRFIAPDAEVDTVLGAASMLPMMAPRRWVQVQGVERWDTKGAAGTKRRGVVTSPMDRLAAYAADPSPSTTFAIIATKLNGSRKLVKAAKKGGYWVACDTPKPREVPRLIAERAASLGHPIGREVVAALAELVGPELGPVYDALERLSLFVGAGKPITTDALAAVVTRVKQDDVWALVEALRDRNLSAALAAFDDVMVGADSALPTVGAVAWKVRQLVLFQASRAHGRSSAEAAKRAGIPSFRAGPMEQATRALGPERLTRWLLLLAEADQALKGSRRRAARVVETMLIDMCR